MTNKMRTVIKHTQDGDMKVDMISLLAGDIFTLKEPDGTMVGKYKATDHAYLNDDGIETVMCDLIND